MSARRVPPPALALGELQSWLFQRVTAPRGSARALPSSEQRSHRLVRGGRLPAAERLEIYRHAYFARLCECLEDDYPALRHALGTDTFEQLCRGFIERHPPQGPSLNAYGARFAEHCRARTEAWSAFAADLARLEWAVVEAIHAEEGERLDAAALARCSPEEWSKARLLPSPALRLLRLTHSVAEYYQCFLDGTLADGTLADGTLADGALADGTLAALQRPAPAASVLAVCRRGEDVWRLRLSPSLAALLGRLVAGTPLLEALDPVGVAGAEGVPPSADELQAAFQDWVACGLFAGVLLGDEPAAASA